MSSKTQFKDALKRENKIISELKIEIQRKDDKIKMLSKDNLRLMSQIFQIEHKKKWWQFWN